MAYCSYSGTEPALLFLHGTGCDSQDYAATLTHLRALVPFGELPYMITADFRGHGASQVPDGRFSLGDLAQDVVALLDQSGMEQVVLVGHSLGGMVAMEVAHCEQEAGHARLAGLLLLEGWTNLRVARDGFESGRLYVGLSDGQAEAVRRKADDTRARFAQSDWQAFWRTVIAFDAGAYLKQSQIPIMQVYGTWGHHGGALGVPERENIRWRWIEGAGHYLPLVAPEYVARLCLGLVDEVKAQGPACQPRLAVDGGPTSP